MKLELPYFKIGKGLGGNQSELGDLVMRMGGCAAVTACDFCVYMALYHRHSNLYPYDINNLNIDDFNKFAKIMKPYLRPRIQGITNLNIYVRGLSKYLNKFGTDNIEIIGFSGLNSEENAIAEIKKKLNQGLVIPYLLLRHKNPQFSHLTWHWFIIIGYEERAGEFFVKVVTYGRCSWLPFCDLWETGYKKKGGMILISSRK